MPLDWQGLAGPPRKTGGSKARSRKIAAGAFAVCVAGVLLWLSLGRGTGADDENGKADPAAPNPNESAAVLAAEPEGPRVSLDLYPKEQPLAGVELLARGDLDEAEKWFLAYLKAHDGRDDQALYALGMLHASLGRRAEAEDVFRRLVDVRQDSLRAGDGLYELGRLLEKGRPAEAGECFKRAVQYYSRSRGGMRAARALADGLYDEHVIKSVRRSEWERIRDLYSDALPGLEGAERDGVIERLDKLNEWVIFTTYARPKADYPTNISFHSVKSGETLGHIAKRYGVTVGALKRLNGIRPGSNVIRAGEELKILRGTCEILVDLSDLRLTVKVGGKFFREHLVGIGREGRTPVGKFKIATRVPEPPWYSPTGEVIPYGDPRNILGTRWLGFERKGAGRGIGIHGSVEKDGVWQGIGKAKSNGCVRMRNPDVEEIFDFAPIGTEVTIVE
ncbi:MAG: L,D-transpeptidase family protein [Planctomycetota bacterium]|jgi:lipoprotein-anchoring transpeptidase ErfK/SrfK